MYKICLVEDEKTLANLVKTYLEKENFIVKVYDNGNDVIKDEEEYNLYILDIMLKDDINGYDIIKHIRKTNKEVPVIFTSARDQDLDKIIGLELGSDDYITKPYSLKELVLRVKNIIKRVYKEDNDSIKHYDTYTIDKDKRKITENNEEIKLTTLEFDLLLLFINNIEKVYSRDDILNHIWGDDYFGSDRAVDDLVRRLRKKMPKLRIETLYGMGYRCLQ